MPDWEIIGEPPDMSPEDQVETADDITRFSMVAFERVGPRRIRVRVVRPQEYSAFSGAMYQVDRGKSGGLSLRRVEMRSAGV